MRRKVRVDDVAAISQQEQEPRARQRTHDDVGGLRSVRLLDQHERALGAVRGRVALHVRGEPLAHHAPERRPPCVLELAREELARLLVLHLAQGEVARVKGGGSEAGQVGQEGPEVPPEHRLVDGNDAVVVAQDPKQPGAAAARRAEYPHEALLDRARRAHRLDATAATPGPPACRFQQASHRPYRLNSGAPDRAPRARAHPRPCRSSRPARGMRRRYPGLRRARRPRGSRWRPPARRHP